MKKVFLVFLLLISLVGCSSSKKEVIISSYDIQSKEVDMSKYDGVTDSSHFRLVTCQEFINTVDNKGSGVFYFGREGCQCCQTVTKYLAQVADELDVTIYYIDVYNEEEDLINNKELQDKLLEYMYDIAAENEDGKKSLYTPHLFQVINGELGDNQICYDGISIKDPTNEQIEEYLIPIYRRILLPFSKVEE